MDHETLRTGGKILTYIAEHKSPQTRAGYVVSKHVTESAEKLIKKLRGFGRKRVGETGSRGANTRNKKTKRA